MRIPTRFLILHRAGVLEPEPPLFAPSFSAVSSSLSSSRRPTTRTIINIHPGNPEQTFASPLARGVGRHINRYWRPSAPATSSRSLFNSRKWVINSVRRGSFLFPPFSAPSSCFFFLAFLFLPREMMPTLKSSHVITTHYSSFSPLDSANN